MTPQDFQEAARVILSEAGDKFQIAINFNNYHKRYNMNKFLF